MVQRQSLALMMVLSDQMRERKAAQCHGRSVGKLSGKELGSGVEMS